MNKSILKIACIALSLQSNLLMAMDAGVHNGAKFPLHKAVAQGDTEVVRLLVDNRAPLELRNEAGLTPLQVAFQSKLPLAGRIALVSTLVESDANMEVLDTEKSPLVFSLIKKVDLEGVKLLLGYGVSLYSTDSNGRTPLIYSDLKVKVSQNPKTEEIADLIEEYVDGKRKPTFAYLIQTQEQRAQLITDSRQSVLNALAEIRKELEEKIALRERENYFLQIDLQALELQNEIKALRADL